jgi:hypothetical protein
VYLLHRYNSKFVTFCKNPRETDEQVLKLLNTNVGYNHESIHQWRDSVKLARSDGVLVAFAWAHDDEIRNIEMFPEVLGIDVTFGVNKERRELLIAAGMHGNKKVFTAFRCFIAGKQEQTYTWIINQVMTYLLTPNILRYNSYISMDQEFALNNSVGTSMSASNVCFTHSKFQLDCYHVYCKVWKESILPSSDKKPQQ